MKLKIVFLIIIFFITGCDAARQIYDMINIQEEIEVEYEEEDTELDEYEEERRMGLGGTLHLSMRQPLTLNPILNEDITVDKILKLIFEPLFILDEQKKPIPNIADSIIFSSNGLAAVITLRSDVFWNDGTPISTRDVTFTIEEIRGASENIIYKKNVSNIMDFTRISDKELRINFRSVSSDMKYMLCFPIIPEHYYRGHMSLSSLRNMEPLGNGAYKFVSYKPVTEVRLTANNMSFKNEPHIKDITVIVTNNRETDLQAFEQGVIDIITADLSDWAKYSGRKTINTIEFVSKYFDFIGFNFNNELFADNRVRAPITRCIDINEVVLNIYMGHAVTAHTPVSPASWLFERDTRLFSFDLNEARIVFEWLPVPDGFEGIKILVNAENDERIKLAEILSANLNSAGLYSKVEAENFDVFIERVENSDFDILIAGLHLSVNPDFNFLFHSSGNMFNYKDETMDALLYGLSNAFNEEDFLMQASLLQKYIVDESVCIGIAFRKHAMLLDSRVQGEIKPVINNMFANVYEWFIKGGQNEPKQ